MLELKYTYIMAKDYLDVVKHTALIVKNRSPVVEADEEDGLAAW